MRYKCIYQMDIGNICIEEEDGKIIKIECTKEPIYIKEETELLKKAHEELVDYFRGKRKKFDLPLNLKGTNFQLKVWNALLTIPYGETRSYGDIAKQIGNSKACRAVGGANNKNPIMIVVPCHRVIGQNGKLVGFGAGLDIKSYLLKLEEKSQN